MSRLSRNELLAAIGGLVLGASLLAPWYEAVSALATIAGYAGRGTHSAWQVHDVLRWVLLAIAVAPLVLAYVVARDVELSWGHGELTAVLAITAFGLVAYVGIVDRPGEPPAQIALAWGWLVALAGSGLMLVGAALRAGQAERRRKPPGSI